MLPQFAPPDKRIVGRLRFVRPTSFAVLVLSYALQALWRPLLIAKIIDAVLVAIGSIGFFYLD